MKRFLLTSFLLGLIPSANAADTCSFVSEYYPDVTIEVINLNLDLLIDSRSKISGLALCIVPTPDSAERCGIYPGLQELE